MLQHIPLKELFDYERGKLGHEHHTMIAEHLAACSHCAENMALFSDPHCAQVVKLSKATAHRPKEKANCLSPEKIGQFINNELPKRQRTEVEKHLAFCNVCRQQLVAIVQASFAPVNEEEKISLAALPPLDIAAQIRQIKEFAPESPGLSDRIRELWDWLDDRLPALPAPRPAWALAVLVVLSLAGTWWAWPAYQYYRLAQKGQSELAAQFRIYYLHQPRLAGDYRSTDTAEVLSATTTEGRKDKEGQTIEAMLKKALDYDQDGENARLRLAQYFLLQKNYSSGDSLLKLLEAASPQNAAVHNDRGYWFFQRGRYDSAAVAFAQALALKPQLDEALYNLAIAQTQLGDTTAAMKSWKKYLALDNIKTEWRNAAAAQLQELERDLMK
jgi:tetratricopeptide (TPR) repeat protein